MNRAFYGDIHGCINELEELYDRVEKKYPGIEHWHVGDMVDRGLDSGATVQFCMDNFTGGIMGNHEATIIKAYENRKKYGTIHRNPIKAKTISELNDERVEYMKSLPHLHLFDDVKLALAHGGLLPKIRWQDQEPMIACRLQMYKKNAPLEGNRLRWWGGDAKHQPKTGKTEDQSREEGYVRWYEEWDHEYSVIYGHSVMGLEPYVHQNAGYGKTIGIDTGSCFGGNLTAFIFPEMKFEQKECEEYQVGKNIKAFKGMLWKENKNKE